MLNPQGWPQWQRRRYAVTVAAPAVATDWSVTVPAGRVWEVQTIQSTLVSDANAFTRQVALSLTDPTTNYLVLAAYATQLASLTRRYTWMPSASPYAVSNDIVSQTPIMVMQAGSVIKAVTTTLQVGDQWSAVTLYVVETMIGSQPLEVQGVPDYVSTDAHDVTQYIPSGNAPEPEQMV